MAVKIRLSRTGKRSRPSYRIIVTDIRNKRDGKILENIGTYDPMKNPPAVKLEKDRLDYWIKCGAKPSEIVSNLIKKS